MKLFLLMSAVVLFSANSWADDEESKSPQAQAINSACVSDAQTAGCGEKKVGSGLIMCLHTYKKSHAKDFHFSDSCKAALESVKEKRKEKRAERKMKKAAEHD